ncbi:MAG: hypothetical protein ACT4OU_03160 [Hyphomicrobium sp.]
MIGDNEEDDGTPRPDAVVAFPYSRLAPTQWSDPDAPVVYGAFASLIGMPREQTTGHWCSYCRIIWYGYLLEVACPKCGNRQG